MSYILEALKKSDRERQQRAGPVLARAAHQKFFASSPRPPRWPLWGLALVAAAALPGTVWLAWHSGLVSIEFSAGRNPAEHPQPLLGAQSTPAGAAPAAALPAVPVRPAGLAGPPPEHAVPELWQLPVAVRAAIPALDFSLHVYSESPEQRSIIINDRMMREGEFVEPDLQLVAITRQGVIMRSRAEYFRVGILEDW